MKNKDRCPNCGYPCTQHLNSDLYYCDKCGFDEQRIETLAEVLYIIEHALDYMGMSTNEDDFMVPNGSLWNRKNIMDFLKENLN